MNTVMNLNEGKGGFSTAGLIYLLIAVLCFQAFASAQSDVKFAGKQVFLSGANVPWVNWASDLGPRSASSSNNVNFSEFANIFKTIHDNGGNTMRLWLFTNGTVTPVFDSNGYVTGPGPYAIQDLKHILSLAEQNNIGLILCLWSFDMLSYGEMDSTQLNDNFNLLTDTSYTMAFISNALVPMVDSVRDNPAIVAWEIFNEPEGMSDEFGTGWGTEQIPMSDIQRCINLMAGAIHRADPNAMVTSGAWAFQSLANNTPVASTKKSWMDRLNSLSPQSLKAMTGQFNSIYRISFTPEQFVEYLGKINATQNYNYYSNGHLIAAGGDSLGTLDFYSVHWYSWMLTGLAFPSAPFLVPCSTWGLSKPVLVAEFGLSNIHSQLQFVDLTSGLIYSDIYANGYAGALDWSWETAQSDQQSILQALTTVLNGDPGSVNVNIVNLALGAPVTTSSNDVASDSTSDPANITDGDPATRWQASSDSSQWILLDLGQADSVDRIVIDWANNSYAKQFSLGFSTDGNSWTSMSVQGDGSNYLQQIGNLNEVGRYVKFSLDSQGNGPYSISEIYVFGDSSVPSTIEVRPPIASHFLLYQNYPNPFNPSTVIGFNVPSSGLISLKVYVVLGREVGTLVDKVEQPGSYAVRFDASELPSGVYFYRLEAGNFHKTMKMMVVK